MVARQKFFVLKQKTFQSLQVIVTTSCQGLFVFRHTIQQRLYILNPNLLQYTFYDRSNTIDCLSVYEFPDSSNACGRVFPSMYVLQCVATSLLIQRTDVRGRYNRFTHDIELQKIRKQQIVLRYSVICFYTLQDEAGFH